MTLRRIMLWSGAAVLLLLLGFCAPGWLWGPKLDAIEMRPKDLTLTLVVNGRVLAPGRVTIGVQQTGIVARRLVDEGDTVQKDQLLLELDSTEASASLAKAQAELAKLHQVADPANRAVLSQADSSLRLAQWQNERSQQLYKEGIIPESQLQESKKALELAQAAQVSAHAQSRSSSSGSDLLLAKANLDIAQAKLAQTRVLAPASGVVLTRSVEQGDQVQPGKQLYTLALDEPLQLLIQPDERHLAQLKVGQEALASTDAFPDRRFPAHISYVSPGVDATRGTVDVKLTLTQMPDFLRPDMTVSVEIILGQSKAALVIPIQALRSSMAPYVLVLREGRAQKVAIKLGQRGEREVEVVDGLKSGDIILLSLAAKEGSHYRPALQGSP